MDILLFILSFIIILLGCEFFTNAVEWLGKRYNLSEGAVGSVLAAVGTAMPETLIPLIAIIFVGGQAGEDIGVGAILGAPFMLATLAMFVCGLALFLFAKRRGTRTLHINGKLIRRDLKFFLLCYSLAVVAAFMPPDLQIVRWVIGFVLIPIYIYHTYVTVKRREGQCETGDLKCLHLQNYADRLRGDRPKDENPDEVSEAFRKAVYIREPPTYLIFIQTFMGLLAIIVGANIFVNQIDSLSEALNINPTIIALLIAPIATELPEKFNSMLWIREGKDTYAIGNITGAMVFQSCFPVTIGILLTSWHIDLTNTVQLLQAVAIGIALLSGVILYWRSSHRELHMSGLMLGGVLYALFIVLVLLEV
ncbi:MAG: sodium:calcium antiporter [Methanomassiliicoccales archaeon]|jgi:cation:H+ antiporter